MSLKLAYPPLWSLIDVHANHYGFEVNGENVTIVGKKDPLLGIGHARTNFNADDIRAPLHFLICLIWMLVI